MSKYKYMGFRELVNAASVKGKKSSMYYSNWGESELRTFLEGDSKLKPSQNPKYAKYFK